MALDLALLQLPIHGHAAQTALNGPYNVTDLTIGDRARQLIIDEQCEQYCSLITAQPSHEQYEQYEQYYS